MLLKNNYNVNIGSTNIVGTRYHLKIGKILAFIMRPGGLYDYFQVSIEEFGTRTSNENDTIKSFNIFKL